MFRDYTNYDVLPSGRIWSKKQKKFLKPYTDKNGYQRVGLTDNEGNKHKLLVHKIVYFAVNGLLEYPEGYELNHIDECKTNNHISNLELVTHKQNVNHGTRTERCSKRVGVFKDDVLIMVFPSIAEAGRQGFNNGAVSACCRGERKTHKGYVWKYLDDEQ